jgi:quercetin dioxygenase-like cupin family protein
MSYVIGCALSGLHSLRSYGTKRNLVVAAGIVGVALVIITGFVAAAQNAQSAEKRMTPAEVQWPTSTGGAVGTSGVSGIQTVVLKGDPTKAGLYTLLLRLGPNTRIQAHSHRDDRVATVISGKWYFGYGRQFNEAALKELPAGSFYTEPPGVHHFAMTRAEAVTIQVTGTGPSDTVYFDPRNDPAKK